MGTLARTVLLILQCSGPYCGPDSQFEHPNWGVFGDAGAPAAAIASDGSFLVVWEARAGGKRDILFNRRTQGPHGPQGGWLDLPRRLDTDEAGSARSMEVRLAAGAPDHVFAAWQDSRNGKDDIFFNRSVDGGLTWLETDVRIGSTRPGAVTSSMVSLAADAAGRVYLAWEDLRNGERDIYIAGSNDHGSSWSVERRVDSDGPGTGVSYHPQLAAWDDGTVLVCWWDERSGEADIYIRRSTDGAATWEGPELRLDPGPPGKANSKHARLSIAGERIAIAWEERWTGREGNLTLRVSEDRGQTWGEVTSHGRGSFPTPLASVEGAVQLGWISGEWWRPLEKTSIAGRIVEIGRPLNFHMKAIGPQASSDREMSGLQGPASVWLGAMSGQAWAVRTGVSIGRGIVEIFSNTDAKGWNRVQILPFGGDLLATDQIVRAHSPVGAVASDGTLHLVWVAEINDSEDLGYFRLAP